MNVTIYTSVHCCTKATALSLHSSLAIYICSNLITLLNTFPKLCMTYNVLRRHSLSNSELHRSHSHNTRLNHIYTLITSHIHILSHCHTLITSHSNKINNSYLPVIGVHEMHGRMHPNNWKITILLVVDLCSSLAYFMMTQPFPIAGKLSIKTLVARQLPTSMHTSIHSNSRIQTIYEHTRLNYHFTDSYTYTHSIIDQYNYTYNYTYNVP